MNNYSYYRVRWHTPETHKTKKIFGQNFNTYEEAEKKYNSLTIDENVLQVELIKAEHDYKDELIYENSLKLKDSENEISWNL